MNHLRSLIQRQDKVDELQDWAMRHRHHNQQWEVMNICIYCFLSNILSCNMSYMYKTSSVNRMIITSHSETNGQHLWLLIKQFTVQSQGISLCYVHRQLSHTHLHTLGRERHQANSWRNLTMSALWLATISSYMYICV